MALAQLFVHLMHFGAGRGDDTRVMHIADIGKPRLVEAVSNAVPCYMLPIVLFGTKTQTVSGVCGGWGGRVRASHTVGVSMSVISQIDNRLSLCCRPTAPTT